MPAIVAIRSRRGMAPCPGCVSLQLRTFKGDIQAVPASLSEPRLLAKTDVEWQVDCRRRHLNYRAKSRFSSPCQTGPMFNRSPPWEKLPRPSDVISRRPHKGRPDPRRDLAMPDRDCTVR